MKARIPPQKQPPLVLTYGITGEKLEQLTALLQKFSLPLRVIAPEEAGQTVGCLAGYPGFSAKEAPISPAPETECLLMSSFADKQVDQLLAALRQEKISISLEALTTPTNQKWTVVQLLEHLEEERRAYQAQREKRG